MQVLWQPRCLVALAAGLVALAAAMPCGADVPATADATLPFGGGLVVVCPAGDGQTLETSQSTVVVQLRDAAGMPCVDFPRQDIWLAGAVPGELFLCPGGGARPEANTDADGRAVIRGTMFAGGQTSTGLMLFVAGQPVLDQPLRVIIRSEDIVGDGSVDLGDVAAFSGDMARGSGDRSDFALLGTVDMVDANVLISHLGHRCP